MTVNDYSRSHFSELDHVFVLTDNLEEAYEIWTKLGFSLSPLGLHSDNLGTANHLAIFETTYFELLGIRNPRPSNALYRELVTHGDAIRGIAVRPKIDLETIAARRAELKLPGIEAVEYSRPVPEYGPDAIAKFASIMDLGETFHAGARHFACHHHTPQYVWPETPSKHKNGVRDVTGFRVISRSFERTVETYAGIFDPSRLSVNHVKAWFKLDNFNIEILEYSEWLRLTGRSFAFEKTTDAIVTDLIFSIEDRGKTAAFFEAAGLSYEGYDGNLKLDLAGDLPLLLHFRTP